MLTLAGDATTARMSTWGTCTNRRPIQGRATLTFCSTSNRRSKTSRARFAVGLIEAAKTNGHQPISVYQLDTWIDLSPLLPVRQLSYLGREHRQWQLPANRASLLSVPRLGMRSLRPRPPFA